MAEDKVTSDKDIGNLMSFLKDRDSKSALEVLDRISDPNILYSEEESGSCCVLYQAVRTNHTNIVEILLQKGANPNLLDEEGETPLFAAFDLEINEEIQTMLYKYGADANIKNKAGNTALMQIALRGIDYGHKCTAKTIFNFLTMCKDFEQMNSRDQYLIHMIPFVHASVIQEEQECHVCVQFLKVLIERGVRVNVCDSTGWTPLHYACASCCFYAVTFLVEHGADINAKSSSQQTVLHSLGQNPSGRDFRVIFEYLVGKGVDINDKDMFGMDVLHYAAATNKICKTSMEIILSHGGKANTKDKFVVPLHLCVIPSVFIAKDHLEDDEDLKNDVSDIINVLVQNGGEINATDNNKLTPIHYALRYEKKVPSVSTLLKNGADLSKRTKTGESAIHRATLYPDLLNCVLGHTDEMNVSININLKDNFGSTPLHWAVYYMEPRCVTMLLNAGADLNIANEMGATPCDLAISLKITDLFESLGIMYCRKTYPLPYTITENDLVSEEELRKEKIGSIFGIMKNALNTRLHEEFEEGEENEKTRKLILDVLTNEHEHGKVQKEFGAEKLRELNGNREDKGGTSENDVICKEKEVCIERKNTLTENNENAPKNKQGALFEQEQSVSDSDASEGISFTINWKETNDISEIECSGTPPEDEHKKDEKLMMFDYPDSVKCSSSSLGGSVNTEECTNVDHMWCDCPELSEVQYDNRSVHLITWSSHLSNHKRSLAAYMNHVLDSKQMGLFSETDENKDIAESIKCVMNTLAQEVKRISPLFEFSIKLAGSWNEGTKITQPDEFDYKLILQRFNTVVQPLESDDPDLKGFVQFRLKDGCYPNFIDFLDNDGYLDGRKVVRALYTSINTALLNVPSGTLGQLYITKYLKIEKGSIDHLSFRWVGPMYKNLLIDVDVVPTILPDSWTCSLLNTCTNKLQIAAQGPSPVVLKTQDSRFVKGWYSYFRISVADHEAEIFKRLPNEILKGYILVKSLMKTLHFPQIRVIEDEEYLRLPSLTTYMLKSAFLHQVEQSSGNVEPLGDKTIEQNRRLNAVTMARSILDYLMQSIDRCYHESFFIPGVNVLANDSLTRFNNKIMFDTEVACLEVLLETGLDEMKSQGLV